MSGAFSKADTKATKATKLPWPEKRPSRDFKPDTHTEELLVTQKAFRAVMDAMARPGLIRFVPPMFQASLANPWMETLVLMLIDNTCSFCVLADDEPTLTRAITMRTYAVPTRPAQAQFAIVCMDASQERCAHMLSELCGGADDAPERGATAIIECAALGSAADADSCRELLAQWARSCDASASARVFRVSGPGVKESHLFFASESWWYEARKEREDEFPCGIDLLLVDREGQVIALPRSATIEPYGQGKQSDEESA